MKQAFVLTVLLGSTLSLSAQGIRLQGHIQNSDGYPIASATVIALPSGKTTASDAQGDYELTEVASGRVILRVRSVGYKMRTDTLQLGPGTHRRNFILEGDETMLEGAEVNSQKQGNANAETLIKVENSIMPVTIIDRRTIQLMGSRRLDEVLKEQTGIAIVNDISSGSRSVGVQMQGFGGEYIMILLDGQPMVGRSSGNFDLSRISVSNIERIEITKGASSNLYGGDALGGTINIITRHNIQHTQGMATLSYGSNETIDASLDGESPVLNHKGTLWLSGNYYHTDGFNTDQGNIKGTTAPPYNNYSGQGRFRYRFDDNNFLSVSGRYGWRRSFMTRDYGVNYTTADVLDEKDINLSANFDHRFSERWRSMTRYYFTRYHADMSVALTQGDSLSASQFSQSVHRLEQQVAYSIPGKLDVISGLGGNIERMDEQVLLNVDPIKSYFAYTQANWNINAKTEFTVGLRYDHILQYGWRLDPSMALKYKLLPHLTMKAAYGTAFKAPDMKKLYQVFYNPAYNYLLVGSQVLRNVVNQLLESGQISQYELEPAYNEIKSLQLNAEMSKSYNFSMIWESPDKTWKAEGSLFYHDVRNQINPILVGVDVNRHAIYSYRNNARAYYKGAELSLNYHPIAALQMSAGYQYLIAKDKTVEDEIREGGKYYSPLFDPNTGYVNYSPSAKDYWGMENRSRHMLNARVFYTYAPLDLTANVRVNYRGKYPFSDKNSNGYMDRFDTFVQGYFLLNAGLEKRLKEQRLSLRLNAENLLNFVDPKVPSQPGRVFFMGLSYHFY